MEGISHPESFNQELHNALQNLYDPVALSKSRLVLLFSLDSRPNPGLALQDTITHAVQSLRPRMDVPLQSNAWRFFNILTYRYLEQTSQNLVADMLGLSVRQLRRDERAAEQWLAAYLWKKFEVAIREGEFLQKSTAESGKLENQLFEGGSAPTREQELEWLRASFPDETISVVDLITSSIAPINPLIEREGIEIINQAGEGLPDLWGQVSAMRQALINLLLAGINYSGGNKIVIDTEAQEEMTSIKIVVDKFNGEVDTGQVADYLTMAKTLADLINGELEIQNDLAFVACLWLPTVEKVPVLIIDDNTDTLQLFQRYLSGTKYLFVGDRDPEKALDTAIEHKPSIIVMDVMMPGMDDWELLGRIRNHPETRNIPVVICTILPQETLAFALGASGFIRKPVSRSAFLDFLEQQVSRGL